MRPAMPFGKKGVDGREGLNAIHEAGDTGAGELEFQVVPLVGNDVADASGGTHSPHIVVLPPDAVEAYREHVPSAARRK
jgi:hypothetical protein